VVARSSSTFAIRPAPHELGWPKKMAHPLTYSYNVVRFSYMEVI
jgi:hypothetical protein